MPLNRRGLIVTALGGALAGACATAPTPAAAAAAGDLATPAERLRAYMLMRGALDDQMVVGCLSGRYYGVVGDEVRPLFGVVSATFAKYRPDGAGGYLGGTYEVPFFTDLTTGEVMDRWLNPYTGETVDVPHGAYPPAKILIQPDLHISLPSPPPGLELNHRVQAPLIIGNDVWMLEETFSTFRLPGGSAPVHYSEMVTLHSTLSEIAEPNAKRVPTQTSFQAVVSWRPWLKMGDRPGNLMATGAGLYGGRIEDLPAPLLRGIQERRPQVLEAPEAPIAALLA